MELHPEIHEGINVSKVHPLADFFYLLVGMLLVVITLMVVAQLTAGVMVRFISFELEGRLFEQLSSSETAKEKAAYLEQSQFLQSLAEDLAGHMQLPDGMLVKVQYDPADIANAYASLGGNIVIYQGLIDQVSTENGLAMVVAHEIAHIKNRDPLMSLGRGTVSVLGLAMLSGFGDSAALGNIVNITGGSALAKFSRNQESRADQDAVSAMLGLYGTLAGADEFFVNMSELEPELGMVFFSTHPATDSRIARILDAGSASPVVNTHLRPLPEVLTSSKESPLLLK